MSEDHVENTGGVPSGENPNEVSGGNDTAGPGAVPTPNWREFVDGLDKLNNSLGSRLDTIREVVTPQPAAPVAPDFDTMSNAELVAYTTSSLQSMVQQSIKEALDPVVRQMSTVQNDVVTTRATLDLKDLRAQHKDFADWKDEMIGLAKQHPTLGFQDVYRLARANNPAKAGQLDTKYNPPPPKPRPFGGLTPSNGKAAEPRLTGEAATRAAYEEVMARHPGILPALSEL
jgi:hypothetical protein